MFPAQTLERIPTGAAERVRSTKTRLGPAGTNRVLVERTPSNDVHVRETLSRCAPLKRGKSKTIACKLFTHSRARQHRTKRAKSRLTQNELTSRKGTNSWGCRSRSVLK